MRWLFLAHLVAETGKVPATCRGDAVERGRAEGWIQASACRALPHSGFWVSPFWIDQFFPDLHAAWNHHDPHGSCCRIWRPRQLLPPPRGHLSCPHPWIPTHSERAGPSGQSQLSLSFKPLNNYPLEFMLHGFAFKQRYACKVLCKLNLKDPNKDFFCKRNNFFQ